MRSASLSERISSSDFIAVMQEAFNRGQQLKFTPSGSSMLPMLDGKEDTVTFAPRPEKLKKYDVVFYWRPRTSQMVLHRLVGFAKDGTYIFSGDNQYYLEPGVRDEDILALMVEFTHNGKKYSVSDFSYRLYIHRMMLKKRLRMILSKVRRHLFKK